MNKVKLLIAHLVFISLFTGYISAEERSNVQQGYGLRCLDATYYNKQMNKKGGDAKSEPPVNGVLTYILESKANSTFPTNTPIYLVVCKGGFCQALIPDQQATLFGSSARQEQMLSHISFDQPDSASSTRLSSDNTFTTTDGKLIINGLLQIPYVTYVEEAHGNKPEETVSKPERDVTYLMYGGYFLTETTTPTGGVGGGGENGNDNGLKNGSFIFSQLADGPTPSPDDQDCVDLHWDPYGRVFDSQSLEPMMGVRITLFDAAKQLVSSVINPVISKIDGVFNFVVREGIYSLGVDVIPPTHVFTATPRLASTYLDIYHKAIGKSSSLYKPSADIRELIDTPEEQAVGAPNPEERDVALDPGNNKPYVGVISSIPKEDNVVFSNGHSTFYGKASHPFPIVQLVRKDNGKVIYTKTVTDEKEGRYGFWKITVPQKKIPTDTSLQVLLKKNPAYFPFAPPLEAEGVMTPISFEPILRSIEGFAKDESGAILPHARISIRLKQSDTDYYTTNADANGYFFISSRNLPSFSYSIAFTPRNSTRMIRKSTSVFAKENAKALAVAKVRLNEERTIGHREAIVSYAKQNNDLRTAPEEVIEGKSKNTIPSSIITVVVFLVSLIIIGGVVGYYALNKKNQFEG